MAYGLPEQQPAGQVPVCPRHPDRPSYVRCQRCGRPACPECQRPAAVGVQCADCVDEARKRMPTQRTALGGRARDGRPVVTYTLMVLCAVVFLGQFLLPTLSDRLLYAGVYTGSEPWRMLTATFLHSTSFLMHIAFNMYALFVIGQALEPMLGRIRFLALYLLSGFGGSVAVLMLEDPRIGVVGASGAVFGLFGALLVVMRARGGNFTPILVIIGINLVIGFIPGLNVSWQAHVGGLATGAALAAIMAYAPRGKHRATVQWAGIAAVAVLLTVLTWVGWQTVPARVFGA
ncbi:rhomboid family intramembrane serine protease [Zafaria sp. Z1313]|uniref:rhomboid family intramembrane serine protease n=1 Tax=unclassified Zafaria TaxID=2828765 RepID=UPI002E76CE96|nr:rhomboid family intramembrane serine protease [Zafaria sp. J156]MEE1621484.1 rhomboid family intramembrane serine protease [Zafaria sp. J156]